MNFFQGLHRGGGGVKWLLSHSCATLQQTRIDTNAEVCPIGYQLHCIPATRSLPLYCRLHTHTRHYLLVGCTSAPLYASHKLQGPPSQLCAPNLSNLGLPASHATRHGLDVVSVLGQVVGFAAMLGILVLHVLQLLLVSHDVVLGKFRIVGGSAVMLGGGYLGEFFLRKLFALWQGVLQLSSPCPDLPGSHPVPSLKHLSGGSGSLRSAWFIFFSPFI